MKNGFLKGVGLGAGFLSTALFAAAFTINVFAPGDVISSAKINENFAIAAPVGAIVPFYLASCPQGWAPADGSNGTPDLRGQFIRGRDDVGTGAAGNDPSGVRTIGNVQTDAFQGFVMSLPGFATYYGAGPIAPSSVGGTTTFGTFSQTGGPITDGTHGTPRTANETRPKNVALTYCMRHD